MPGPRHWLRNSAQFGQVDPADWKETDFQSVPLVKAAQLQHELVRAVRHQQVRMGQTTNDTAVLIGMNPDQLRRIYRGEARLTVENMFKIARAVGLELDLQINRVT